MNKPGERITVAFFEAPTPTGAKGVEGTSAELYAMLEEALKTRIIRGYQVALRRITSDCSREEAIRLCLSEDVLIFDGSIETEDSSQYRLASELMKCLDYVLIVSRTMLPYNFMGMRKGGAPQILPGVAEHRESMTNIEILQWILKTLENSSLELPRKLKYYSPNKRLSTLNSQELQKVLNLEAQLMNESDHRIETEPPFAFVSYISKYSEKASNSTIDEPHVETLFPMIREISQLPETSNSIRYFPPGSVSLEFMTIQRRFEVTSSIEDFIRGCKAFWIYKTPDYEKSWWTFGERMSLWHIYHKNIESCPDIFVIVPSCRLDGSWDYQVNSFQTEAEKRGFLLQFQLNETQEQELENLWINSNSETVAYEKVNTMRGLSRMPNFLLDPVLHFQFGFIRSKSLMFFREILKTELENGSISQEETDKKLRQKESEFCNINAYRDSIRSFGYSKEFWENHLVECPFCRVASQEYLTPYRFMHFTSDYFVSISPRTYCSIMDQVNRIGSCNVILPCKGKHSVVVQKSKKTRWRWWTIKNGRPSGPNGVLLEKVEFLEVYDHMPSTVSVTAKES